jgi:hypothetical protein
MLKYLSMTDRKFLKKKALEYKGCKCILCGYHKCDAALHFHHVNGFDKEKGISRIRSWKKMVLELDKCVLVCSNCHSEVHSGFVDISIFPELDPTFLIHVPD